MKTVKISNDALTKSIQDYKKEVALALDAIEGAVLEEDWSKAVAGMDVLTQRQAQVALAIRHVVTKNGLMK